MNALEAITAHCRANGQSTLLTLARTTLAYVRDAAGAGRMREAVIADGVALGYVRSMLLIACDEVGVS